MTAATEERTDCGALNSHFGNLLQPFRELQEGSDVRISEELLLSLKNYVNGNDLRKQQLAQDKAMHGLQQLCFVKDASIRRHVTIILGSVVSGRRRNAAEVLSCGAFMAGIETLQDYLSHAGDHHATTDEGREKLDSHVFFTVRFLRNTIMAARGNASNTLRSISSLLSAAFLEKDDSRASPESGGAAGDTLPTQYRSRTTLNTEVKGENPLLTAISMDEIVKTIQVLIDFARQHPLAILRQAKGPIGSRTPLERTSSGLSRTASMTGALLNSAETRAMTLLSWIAEMLVHLSLSCELAERLSGCCCVFAANCLSVLFRFPEMSAPWTPCASQGLASQPSAVCLPSKNSKTRTVFPLSLKGNSIIASQYNRWLSTRSRKKGPEATIDKAVGLSKFSSSDRYRSKKKASLKQMASGNARVAVTTKDERSKKVQVTLSPTSIQRLGLTLSMLLQATTKKKKSKPSLVDAMPSSVGQSPTGDALLSNLPSLSPDAVDWPSSVDAEDVFCNFVSEFNRCYHWTDVEMQSTTTVGNAFRSGDEQTPQGWAPCWEVQSAKRKAAVLNSEKDDENAQSSVDSCDVGQSEHKRRRLNEEETTRAQPGKESWSGLLHNVEVRATALFVHFLLQMDTEVRSSAEKGVACMFRDIRTASSRPATPKSQGSDGTDGSATLLPGQVTREGSSSSSLMNSSSNSPRRWPFDSSMLAVILVKYAAETSSEQASTLATAILSVALLKSSIRMVLRDKGSLVQSEQLDEALTNWLPVLCESVQLPRPRFTLSSKSISSSPRVLTARRSRVPTPRFDATVSQRAEQEAIVGAEVALTRIPNVVYSIPSLLALDPSSILRRSELPSPTSPSDSGSFLGTPGNQVLEVVEFAIDDAASTIASFVDEFNKDALPCSEKDAMQLCLCFSLLTSTLCAARRCPSGAELPAKASKVYEAAILALRSSYHGLQMAASHLLLCLSRSIHLLHTAFTQPDIVEALISCLDSDDAIKSAALAVLCNLALEVSPAKSTLSRGSVIQVFTNLLRSHSIAVRRNALWVLKNLVYLAPLKLKQRVLLIVTARRLADLLCDEDRCIREHAVNLVRNLTHGGRREVTRFLKQFGRQRLRHLLTSCLEDLQGMALVHWIHVVSNIAAGNDEAKDYAIWFAPKILKFLNHSFSNVRMAALWFVHNLLWNDNRNGNVNLLAMRLKELKLEDALKMLCQDPDMDVRNRAVDALTALQMLTSTMMQVDATSQEAERKDDAAARVQQGNEGGESAVLASAPRADVLGLSSERMVEPSSPPLTETPSHNQEPGSLSTQNRGANGPTGIVPLVPPLSLPMVGSEQSAGREGSEQITPVAMATAVTTRPGSEPSTLLSRLPRPALTPTLSLAPVPSLPYLPPPTVSPQDDELRPSLLSSGASLPRRGRTEFNEDGRFSAPSGFDESTSTSVSEAPPEAASVYDEERASSTTGERLATIEEELGIPAMSTVESGRNTTPPIGPDFVLPPERPPLVDRWRRRERLSFGSPEVVVITPESRTLPAEAPSGQASSLTGLERVGEDAGSQILNGGTIDLFLQDDGRREGLSTALGRGDRQESSGNMQGETTRSQDAQRRARRPSLSSFSSPSQRGPVARRRIITRPRPELSREGPPSLVTEIVAGHHSFIEDWILRSGSDAEAIGGASRWPLYPALSTRDGSSGDMLQRDSSSSLRYSGTRESRLRRVPMNWVQRARSATLSQRMPHMPSSASRRQTSNLSTNFAQLIQRHLSLPLAHDSSPTTTSFTGPMVSFLPEPTNPLLRQFPATNFGSVNRFLENNGSQLRQRRNGLGQDRRMVRAADLMNAYAMRRTPDGYLSLPEASVTRQDGGDSTSLLEGQPLNWVARSESERESSTRASRRRGTEESSE